MKDQLDMKFKVTSEQVRSAPAFGAYLSTRPRQYLGPNHEDTQSIIPEEPEQENVHQKKTDKVKLQTSEKESCIGADFDILTTKKEADALKAVIKILEQMQSEQALSDTDSDSNSTECCKPLMLSDEKVATFIADNNNNNVKLNTLQITCVSCF
ncbi:hypothetical protein ACF0H5_017814 [Mactra antiquata]